MKVFWSWQSDTPGKVGRHLVRDSLAQAIEQIRSDLSIYESVRDDLHLDHDRKGVSGSPDLARVIFSKIRESCIFVADVTPVGATPKDKSLMNANVAIELGYAMAHVTDERILMVLNTAWGTREDLPFDLRQKAGPIIYNLAIGADADERAREKAKLAGALKRAIRDCLSTANAEPNSDNKQEAAMAELAREEVLDEIISRGTKLIERDGAGDPIEPMGDKGWLHLYAHPTLRTTDLVEEAKSNSGLEFWEELLRESREVEYGHKFSPDLRPSHPIPTVEGWKFCFSSNEGERKRNPRKILDLIVGDNGKLEMHCGRAGDRADTGFVVLEALVGGLTLRFLAFAGALYRSAGYRGPIEFGVAICGVRGAKPYTTVKSERWEPSPTGFERDEYRQTRQLDAKSLWENPRTAAQDLLKRFFRGLTKGQYDPFSENVN